MALYFHFPELMIITHLLELLCFLSKVINNYDFPPNVWIKKMFKEYGVSFFGQVAQAERLDRENIAALSSFGFHCFLASRKIFQNGTNIKEYEAPGPAAFCLRAETSKDALGYHCLCDSRGRMEKMDAPEK